MKGEDMGRKGFTLTEVLVALVIIGIVAAFTIPTMSNKINGEQYQAALRKAVSALNQALNLNYAERGAGASDAGNDVLYLATDIFMKYMKLVPLDGLDAFPGNVVCYGPTAQTPDGIIYCIEASNWNGGGPGTDACNIANTIPCAARPDEANAFIDVNGQKGPNSITESADLPKDQYKVMIYNQKVLPFGDAAQQIMYKKGK